MEYQGEELVVRVFGKNATLVDGVAVAAKGTAVLKNGSSINMGGAEITVHIAGTDPNAKGAAAVLPPNDTGVAV